MPSVKLSLLIPIYNESERIRPNIDRVLEYLKTNFRDFELVIVDDGSTDGSQAGIRDIAKDNAHVHLHHYQNGPSRRENLAESMKRSRGEVIAFMDLDLSSNLETFKELTDSIEKGSDIAIGSRYKGIAAERSIGRLVISVLYNFFVKTMFNSKIKDHQCGFKAFKRDAAQKLVEECGYDTSFERGWAWDAEMLIRAQRHGMSIAEIPIKWRDSGKSSFELKRELKIIRYLLRLRRVL